MGQIRSQRRIGGKANAIPPAFALPARPPGQSSGGLIHIETHFWDHSNGFVRPVNFKQEQKPLIEKQKLRCISVYYLKGELMVIYTWDHSVGAPRRPLTKKLTLLPNQ